MEAAKESNCVFKHIKLVTVNVSTSESIPVDGWMVLSREWDFGGLALTFQ